MCIRDRLAQVAGALAGGVVRVGLPGHGRHLGGELRDGEEALGGDREREDGGQRGADGRLAQRRRLPGGAVVRRALADGQSIFVRPRQWAFSRAGLAEALVALGRAGGRGCLLYTSDAADEEDSVDLGGRRIIKK